MNFIIKKEFMITKKTVAQEASLYVFDLNNCAREFGFKADEGWELNVASAEQKRDIEKRYYPTMSAKGLPEILSPLFNLVAEKLIQVKSGIVNSLNEQSLAGRDLQYIVAYNPKRLLR
jgi:hypothetical protein